MTEQKRHILLNGFSSNEDFRSRRTARNPYIPVQNRPTHGNRLSVSYNTILTQFASKRPNITTPITEDIGIYVEVTSQPGVKLILDSLDTIDFKLCNCRKQGNQEVALIFIPETRRLAFQKKIRRYLDQNTRNGQPKHRPLIDSIAEIRLARLKDFWTDPPELFPQDPNQSVWWELWLKRRADEDTRRIAQQLVEHIGGQLGNTSLTFFGSMVFLIKSTVTQLENALELIASLEELRRPKETPTILIHSSPRDQQEWVNNLRTRVEVKPNISTAVSILDTGINYNHPLLATVCSAPQSECWNPSWPHFGSTLLHNTVDHGSRQAGLVAFGDLQPALLSNATIELNYVIESARIFPPTGVNEPALYGAITVHTAGKLEDARPDWKRVYSLAVTADIVDGEGGLPTSWSAKIDHFSFGINDRGQRLFVISAGNNRAIQPGPDHWDQLHTVQIEDPAQSWNALTVGAFTEKTTNDDPNFDGWSPFARLGDIAPASRSSVSWGWRNHAPYKPDLVAEGGNRLLSPDQREIADADVVSLLTTSGNTTGQLFEVSADTSAACALVSRQAAILMTEYPDYWPETIRGILVHTAQWTNQMQERFGLLLREHNPKRAKEILLRSAGYGVTDLERARFSANHALTLIAQDTLQPFQKAANAPASDDPKLNKMSLYQLPWPQEVLQLLPTDTTVKLRVTLSYFIEPNPSRRGHRQRYSYQSHGLRFEVIRPGQSLENFRAFINALANSEESYTGPEGDTNGWLLGPQLRTRGSLHSDSWIGSAADLADMHTIAVYPVGGWWKYRTGQDRWRNHVRYSLIVSIDTPDETIDIYSVVENLIQTQVETGI